MTNLNLCSQITQINNSMRTTEDFENSKYVRAVERVKKMKEFYQNLLCQIIGNDNRLLKFVWNWHACN